MKKILVIDSDPGCQVAMRRSLLLEGHDVRVAAAAEEGLALLERDRADLVVVDLMMPGMNGVWAVEKIRASSPGVAILVATGAHEVLVDDVLREAEWPGDAALLPKPFEEAALLRAVRGILRASEERRGKSAPA
jgi:DNA-binding response OmpR family regulator